jgi:hypothetical protein
MEAKRGDLVVIETTGSYTTSTFERVPMSFYDFGVVSTVTREGEVKAWRTPAGGTRKRRNDVRGQRFLLISADKIDARAALAAVGEVPPHQWRDIAHVREVLRPFLVAEGVSA